jgi:hypothetical protein
MAKDDYNVIVYKILTYLYATLKGKEVFTQIKYDKAIDKKHINEDYLIRIYRMMSEEGLIENANFTKAWGRVYIPLFEERELEITAKGIHYLEDNSKMKEAGRFLMDKADSIADLIVSVGLDLLL